MSRSGLPQLHFADFEPQIFWLIVFFVVFYIIIKKIITPYFFSEIESRDSYIEDNLLKVRKLQTQANSLAYEYREKLGFAHGDAGQLINKTKQDVAYQIENAMHKFSQENNDIFYKAHSELRQQGIVVQNEMSVHLKSLLNKASDKMLFVLPEEFVEAKAQEIFRSAVS